MVEALLQVAGMRAGYGESVVLDEIGFALAEGQSLAVLGRNGVGKTTLILTLMGHTRLQAGTMMLRGRRFERLAPNRRVALGLGWVPQERGVFPSLTVEENLAVAGRSGAWTLDRVFALFPALAERRGNFGNQLSGGEQQMLAIGRALMTNPALLLLDEPLEGLAPIIVEELSRTIRRLAAEGMGLIIVEQHAHIALDLTQQALILERGRIVYRGASAELAGDAETLVRFVGLRGGKTQLAEAVRQG